VSPTLAAALADHGAAFSPRYRGFLSDHGPMATLALKGLGATDDEALAYLGRYDRRLEPAAGAPAGYLERRAEHLAAIRAAGPDAVLGRVLPRLISGWARDAYHPLIRIAYGYEWSVPEEVASGLAYLDTCGADQNIAAAAAKVQPGTDSPAAMLRGLRWLAEGLNDRETFTGRLARVVGHPDFRGAVFTVPDNLARLARVALDVFASSHDFFALHLVTGAHAYRILYPFAGPDRDAVFTIGIAAGYVAAGAPDFRDLDSNTGPPEDWLDRVGTDEHDVKLAYSALAQGQFFANRAFVAAAADYLGVRR